MGRRAQGLPSSPTQGLLRSGSLLEQAGSNVKAKTANSIFVIATSLSGYEQILPTTTKFATLLCGLAFSVHAA